MTDPESLRIVLSTLLGLRTVRAEIVEKHGTEQLHRLEAMVAPPREPMPEPEIDAKYAELVRDAEQAEKRAAMANERIHVRGAGLEEFRAARERLERIGKREMTR